MAASPQRLLRWEEQEGQMNSFHPTYRVEGIFWSYTTAKIFERKLDSD